MHKYKYLRQCLFVWTVALQDVVFEQPVRSPSESELEEMDLKYYSPAMHRAALTLPRFVKKVTVYYKWVHTLWTDSTSDRPFYHALTLTFAVLFGYSAYIQYITKVFFRSTLFTHMVPHLQALQDPAILHCRNRPEKLLLGYCILVRELHIITTVGHSNAFVKA